MAVQVFRTDQELIEIGALTVNQNVGFKGNGIEKFLGYKRPSNDVHKHVNEEDKKTNEA